MTKLKLASAALLFLACTQAAHAVDWIERAEAAAQVARQSRAEADRTVALVRIAVTNARNASGTNGSSGSNGSNGSPSATTLAQSAAEAISAYAVLEHLFPDQQPELEIKLAVALADIPESQAKADALVLGRAVANEILLAMPRP